MKNEHFDKEERTVLRQELDNKRKDMDGQKYALDNATKNFNDYRDNHTGTVQPMCFYTCMLFIHVCYLCMS